MVAKEHSAQISIEGSAVEKHRIPSDVLTRVVEGFQDIAWMLGAAVEDMTYGERSFRISPSLKKKYMIQWGLPQPGSYILTFFPPVGHEIATTMREVLSVIADEVLEKLVKLVPDSRLRGKLCEAAMRFLPKTGENWQLNYTHANTSVAFDVKSFHKIKMRLAESLSIPQLGEVLTIKGELLRIDFEAKRVAVRYPPTQRSLDCYYLPEIEDSILESRRELIEVTGRFVLDREGYPERLTEVSTIQPVDLSEMLLSQVELGQRKLVLDQPLVFTPILDEETRQMYTICDTSLGVDVMAVTRETLMDDLIEQLFFLWDTYGSSQVKPDTLTSGALAYCKVLRKRFREI